MYIWVINQDHGKYLMSSEGSLFIKELVGENYSLHNKEVIAERNMQIIFRTTKQHGKTIIALLYLY